MNKRSYQKELEELIERVKGEKKPPRLLLHACCAPCSSYCLEYLSRTFDITVLYYNPNISDPSEYDKRLRELTRLVEETPYEHPVKVLAGRYEPSEFFEMARGMESLPEGGERCYACYRLRLQEAARLAREGGFDFFTTTLSISPLKNAQKINEIGEELSRIYEVEHLPSDFKKKGGYQRSIELSREHSLYRQDYCGCVFSKAEAKRRREARESGEGQRKDPAGP